jgi:hypothetical protein
MSSALSHSSSRSIATRVMYGVALVALLAFGVAAAASYLRSSQALLTGARATMEGLASLEAQRISGELGRAFDGNEALAHALLAQRAGDGVSRAAASAPATASAARPPAPSSGASWRRTPNGSAWAPCGNPTPSTARTRRMWRPRATTTPAAS